MHWVYADLRADAAGLVEDLWGRLQTSIVDYPELLQRSAAEQGETWDHHVPFHDRHGGVVFWAHEEDLSDLLDALFPHDLPNASVDQVTNASVVIQLHAALDAYAKALGISVAKGLPAAVRTFLQAASQTVSVDVFDDLTDCDATRNVLVHNRGIVDDTYIRKVRDPTYHVGELRVVNGSVIDRFAAAVRSVAAMLKVTDNDSGAA